MLLPAHDPRRSLLLADEFGLCRVQLGLFLPFAVLFDAAWLQEAHIYLIGENNLVNLFRRLERKLRVMLLLHLHISM